jgi:glycerophosphoryl diester phosphodiesterase
VLLVAHGAGNDLARLRLAEAAGIDLVEADVHLFRGRIEVRHLKTVGPVPILWDRWYLARPGTRIPVLADLLTAVAPETRLMLDLKGRDTRLAGLVEAELERHLGDRPTTISARAWPLADALHAPPARSALYSVGRAAQLRAVRERLGARRPAGVSVHRRLLTEPLVRDLRERVETVATWPVRTLAEIDELGSWGVNAVISQDLELLRAAAARRDGS